MFTFDGANQLIICLAGTDAIDIAYLYSRWKDWVLVGDNSKYLKAFQVVGGDPTTGDKIITPYFFLTNGWKIRPQEANHVLSVIGILLTSDDSNPFVDTLGQWRISIRSILPIYTETVMVNTGGSSLTTEEHNKLMGIPTASTNAATLLDTSLSGHTTSGTLGKTVQDTLQQAKLSVATNFV